MKLALAVLLATCSCATIAIAQDADQPANPKKAHAKEHQICKSLNVTGSRMPVSTCHTQTEWDAMAKTAASALPADDIRGQGSQQH